MPDGEAPRRCLGIIAHLHPRVVELPFQLRCPFLGRLQRDVLLAHGAVLSSGVGNGELRERLDRRLRVCPQLQEPLLRYRPDLAQVLPPGLRGRRP